MTLIPFKNLVMTCKLLFLVFYATVLNVNAMEKEDDTKQPLLNFDKLNKKSDNNPLVDHPILSTPNISKTDTAPILSPVKKALPNRGDNAKQTKRLPDPCSSIGRKRSTSNPEFNITQLLVKPKRILSIDGGGIRGLIPAMMLNDLEQSISQTLSSKGYVYDAYIADYFDVFAGTSTGGIIALGLIVSHDLDPSCPKYKTSDLVDLYQKEGERIFTQKVGQNLKSIVQSKYSPENLEEELIKKLGMNTSRDVVKEKLFIIPSYNISKHLPKFFSNIKTEGFPYRLWEILRSTSAAPTYFPAMRIAIRKPAEEEKIYYYVDGGVYENNPTAIAVINTRAHFGEKEAYSVLSLGTGKEQKSLKIEKLKNGGKLNWAGSIFSVTKRGHEGSTLKKMDKLSQCFNLDYDRFDIALKEKIGLDAADSVNIQKLKTLAGNFIRSNEWVQYKTKFITEIEINKNRLVKKIRSVLLKKTKILDLSDHPMSGIFLDELIQVLESTNCPVTDLNLSNCRVRGEALKKIIQSLMKNKTISKLNLSYNGIGEDVKTLIDLLSNNKTILDLDISGNGLGLFMNKKEHQGNIETLFNPQPHNISLSSLTLDNNFFQLSGFRKLLNILRDSYSLNLKVLSLKENKVTLIGNEINFKEMDKANLGHLIIDLSGNAIPSDRSHNYKHFKF